MTIGLVLGGGGSRGLAHIGVLQVLEKENIPIDLIVGTSMGGIVGILFALGIPLDQIAKGMRILQQKSLFNVKRWTIRSRQEMLREMLLDALDGKRFSDLKIPTSLMAVDMRRGTETLLQHGPLMPAALATSAVPTIFPPVEIEGIPLADGGIIDSLATHAAYQQGADRVIAVDIEPPLREGKPWVDPIQAITGLQLPFISGSSDPSKIPNTLASMWRAYKILTGHIHNERLKAHPPDVLLQPDVIRYGSLDFKELEGPIQAGVVEAERHLESLKNLADGM